MRNRHCKHLGIASVLIACTLLAGCACRLKDAPSTGVKYYKSLGSVQCTGGGKSIGELEHDLLTAGITITETTCGTDGNMHAAVCGAPDGRIGIFEIDPAQARAASVLGLAPLSTLPGAAEVPCGEQ
jgi:hypothetical protein